VITTIVHCTQRFKQPTLVKNSSDKEKLMFTALSVRFRTLARRCAPLGLAGAALLLASAQLSAQAACHPVNGQIHAQSYTDNTCTAPVGICARGVLNGGIQGNFIELATNIISSQDTPATGMVFATGDITVTARIGNKQGDLVIKDAFVTHIGGNYEATDLFTIVGGTGDLTGASGVIYASGASDPVALTDDGVYNGKVCLP
jgi:hypothetical protein